MGPAAGGLVAGGQDGTALAGQSDLHGQVEERVFRPS